MLNSQLTRRQILKMSGMAGVGLAMAACQPKVVEVEKVVTQEVEKVVEKEVKETVVVTEKEIQVVTPTPGPKRAGEVVTIRYGTFWNMDRINIMNKGIRVFQEQVEDVVIAVEMGGSQYRDKLAVQMAAGTEPDCGISDVFSLGRYADAGLCLDLMPACDARGMDIRNDYRLKGVEIWADKLVDMPWVTFGNAIYYNKTMFQEVGAPDPYDDLGGSWSCDQFVDICRMLTEATGKHALNVDVTQLHHACAGFIYGRCARLYDFREYSYTLNEPATVQAIEWLLHDLYEPGYIIDPETRDATALAGMMDPFSGGAVAMQHMSAGNVGTTTLYVGDAFEWDIAPYPTISGSPDENSSYVSCDPNFVSANTPKREEAVDFILFCAQEEMQNILSRDKLSLPALKSAPYVEGGFLTPPPNHTAVFDEPWQTGRLVTAFFHHNTLETHKIQAREIEYVMLGEKSVQEACDTMQKECQELISYETRFEPSSQWLLDFPASMGSCRA